MWRPKTPRVAWETGNCIDRVSKRLALIARSFFEHRHFFIALSIHDFQAQYLGSIFGFLWSVIKPLALIGIYAVVFSSVVAPVAGLQGETINFGLFVFSGMLPWLAVQESLQRGATVYSDLAHIVRHHRIPLDLLPLTLVMSATASALIAVIAYVFIEGVSGGSFSWWALALLVLIPIQVLFCYGMTLAIATMSVFVRDVSHLTTTVLFVWFFTSPIIFPLETLPGTLQALMWLNPLTCLIQIYRDLLLFDTPPSFTAVVVFIAFTALSVFVGRFLFRKTGRTIVDWV